MIPLHKPIFDVIIPVYNRAATILPVLESVRAQTFKHFVCHVIDDGSTDGNALLAVVKSMADPRFRYTRQHNAGGGGARNTGIRTSTGEWIAFLDSDDSFYPRKLETVAEAIAADSSIDVWAHLARMERGDGVFIVRPQRLPRKGESVADFMFMHREFMHTSTLVVRSGFAKSVGFDQILRKAQDVDFMMRLERAGARLKCIPDVLSIWNDAPAENRVGAPRRPDSVIDWYARQSGFMAPKTRYAFESTYLSYETARVAPFRSAGYIIRAFLVGAVGLRMTLLSFMRAFFSQKFYRLTVNWIIRLKINLSSSF